MAGRLYGGLHELSPSKSVERLLRGLISHKCTQCGPMFFHHGHKSLFFYCAILLAPAQLGTCNLNASKNLTARSLFVSANRPRFSLQVSSGYLNQDDTFLAFLDDKTKILRYENNTIAYVMVHQLESGFHSHCLN